MGVIESQVHPPDAVSHGICPDCSDNLRLQLGVTIDKYIESLPMPVIATEVYHGRMIVKAANEPACKTVGKELREVVQHLMGNVFDCGHAGLPEGCGRTIHCSGCAIRRSVMTTHETGEPQSMVPATLTSSDPDAPPAIAMHITTVKIGELVVLRVDRMDRTPERTADEC